MKHLGNLLSVLIVSTVFMSGCSDEKPPVNEKEIEREQVQNPQLENSSSQEPRINTAPNIDSVEPKVTAEEDKIVSDTPQNPASRDAARRGAMSKFQQVNPPIQESQ